MPAGKRREEDGCQKSLMLSISRKEAILSVRVCGGVYVKIRLLFGHFVSFFYVMDKFKASSKMAFCVQLMFSL